jgi:hypothetical protein
MHRRALQSIHQKWDGFLFDHDLYEELGVTSYREARRDGDSRRKALRYALDPRARLGYALMGLAANLHTAGNRMAGSPYHDTMSEAWRDGVEYGRRLPQPPPTRDEVARILESATRRGWCEGGASAENMALFGFEPEGGAR